MLGIVLENSDETRRLCGDPAMEEDRHIASIVFTDALPADTDLVVKTLEESEYLEVERIGANYADVSVEEVGQ